VDNSPFIHSFIFLNSVTKKEKKSFDFQAFFSFSYFLYFLSISLLNHKLWISSGKPGVYT